MNDCVDYKNVNHWKAVYRVCGAFSGSVVSGLELFNSSQKSGIMLKFWGVLVQVV